jgi:Flp pilus assembly protein TadD
MTVSSRYRVFLSYAHEDLDTIRKVFAGLKERKLKVWFDKEDLGPGRWKSKIIKAITQSRYFVICISEAALRKTGDEPGFQDDELNTAYGIAQDQPDKEFTIIPVRLDDCGRGDFRLTSFQQYDLFPDFNKGLDRLAVDLGGISLADAAARDERTADRKIIDSLLGKAQAAFYANDFEKALTIYNSALAIIPDDSKARVGKGKALGNLCRYEEALSAFNQTLEFNPDHSGAWAGKGAAFANLGRHEDALAAYNQALEVNPDEPGIWYAKGVVLGNLGRHEESLTAYDQVLEFNPDDPRAWYAKGAALGSLGRYEEALIAFNIALKFKPDDPRNWTGKGAALSSLGRDEEALAAVYKALALKPDLKEALALKKYSLSKTNQS